MLERDKKTISMLYDTTCRSYDELYGQEQYEKYTIIKRYVRFEEVNFISWLDLGCGTGLILRYINENEQLASIIPKVYYVGIDISYNCIRNAVDKNEKILSDFIVGDAEHPPIRVDIFNMITSFTTIHHFEEPVKALISLMEKAKAIVIIVTILKREEDLGKIIEGIKNYVDDKELWMLDIIEIGKDIAIIINKK